MALFINAWLVDDDPTANFISKQFLRRNQLAEQFLSLHNPVAALDLIGHRDLSLVIQVNLLLDTSMPLMYGLEFLDALRSKGKLPNRHAIFFLPP